MTATRSTSLELSADDARRITVRAQMLDGDAREDDVGAMLRRVGGVQLDTISVLARSHELTAYARIGAVGRERIEQAYWGSGVAFEYYAHAACVLPIELWPYFAFRRRAIAARYRKKYPDTPLVAEVLARVRDGAVTANDLGGARDGKSGWWSWSHAKNALELLYMRGELACVTRRRWQRVYDLPERTIPAALLAQDLDDATCYRHLVGIAARALGVGTARDIGDYFMLCTPYAGGMPGGRKMVDRVIKEIGLVPVRVEGWDDPAFAHPDALTYKTTTASRTTLLSPFDSLIWAPRQRMERLFGMAMKLEAYTPKHQRVHGYFSMPVLADSRLVGRVDPARENGAFVARYVSIEDPNAVPAIAAAIREAASWVAATDIGIERVVPKKLTVELRRALAASASAKIRRAPKRKATEAAS